MALALPRLGVTGIVATGQSVAGLVSLEPSWRTGLLFRVAALKTLDESLAMEQVTGPSGH